MRRPPLCTPACLKALGQLRVKLASPVRYLTTNMVVQKRLLQTGTRCNFTITVITYFINCNSEVVRPKAMGVLQA